MSVLRRISVPIISAALLVGALTPATVRAQSDRPAPEACQHQAQTGAVAGALLGALLGGAAAGRQNRGGGAAAGALIGGLIGAQAGKHLSKCGRALAARAAIEAAETGEVRTVVTPDRNQTVTVRPGPLQTASAEGRVCKSMTTSIDDGSGGPEQTETATLCKGLDGQWTAA